MLHAIYNIDIPDKLLYDRPLPRDCHAPSTLPVSGTGPSCVPLKNYKYNITDMVGLPSICIMSDNFYNVNTGT